MKTMPTQTLETQVKLRRQKCVISSKHTMSNQDTWRRIVIRCRKFCSGKKSVRVSGGLFEAPAALSEGPGGVRGELAGAK